MASINLASASALAAYSVDYWYTDKDEMRYLPYDGSYCIFDYSTDGEFSSNFIAGVAHARTEWSKVLPISIMETTNNYALSHVYGGPRSKMLELFPDLPNGAAGYTLLPSEEVGTVLYRGSEKTIRRALSGGKLCLVQSSELTAIKCKNVALHEMGHMCGWWGHSYEETDVMYPYVRSVTSPSIRDKVQLRQIYNLFY